MCGLGLQASLLEVGGQGRAPGARDLVNNVVNMDRALSTIHLFHLIIFQPDDQTKRPLSDNAGHK